MLKKNVLIEKIILKLFFIMYLNFNSMTSWDVARLTARLGDHNIRTNTETQHVERKIKRVVRHRGFNMQTLVLFKCFK